MASDQSTVIYLDSCVLIDAVKKDPTYEHILGKIFDEAAADRLKIMLSVFCLAEVGASKTRVTPAEYERACSFMRQTVFEYRSVTMAIAENARLLGRTQGIKPPDAIHVATCLAFGVRWLLTRDDGSGLLGADQQIATAAGPLRIVTPQFFVDDRYGGVANQPKLPFGS